MFLLSPTAERQIVHTATEARMHKKRREKPLAYKSVVHPNALYLTSVCEVLQGITVSPAVTQVMKTGA